MKLAIILLIASLGFAQSPKTIDVSNQAIRYKVSGCNVRKIDFANFSFRIPDPRDVVNLKNGKFERNHHLGWEAANLNQVFFRREVDQDFAIVNLDYGWAGASSNQAGYIFVFYCDGDTLVNSQSISGDMHGDGAELSLSKDASRLTVKSVDVAHGSHGMPELLETGKFVWATNRYRLMSSKVEKIDYSKYQQSSR